LVKKIDKDEITGEMVCSLNSLFGPTKDTPSDPKKIPTDLV
jgi:hypothetical protein